MQASLNIDCFVERNENSLSLKIMKFILSQLLVFFYILLGILFWLGLSHFKKVEDKREIKNKIILTTVIILYNTLPQLILTCLGMFKCTNLYRSDIKVYYWTLDYDLICYEGQHYSFGVLFNFPFIILWTCVIPVISFIILRRNRSNLKNKTFIQRYSFLCEGYRDHTFYWEYLLLGKKLLYILVVTFISSISVFLEFYLCLLLSLAFLAIHYKKNPYEKEAFNNMEKYSHFSCICWALLGVLVSTNAQNSYNALESLLIVFGLLGSLSFLFFWIFKFVSDYIKRKKRKQRVKNNSKALKSRIKVIKMIKNESPANEKSLEVKDLISERKSIELESSTIPIKLKPHFRIFKHDMPSDDKSLEIKDIISERTNVEMESNIKPMEFEPPTKAIEHELCIEDKNMEIKDNSSERRGMEMEPNMKLMSFDTKHLSIRSFYTTPLEFLDTNSAQKLPIDKKSIRLENFSLGISAEDFEN